MPTRPAPTRVPDSDARTELIGELTKIADEERALTRAVTQLYLALHGRPDVALEDVTLLREAVRDCGRARQIVAGLSRRLAERRRA